MRRSPPAVGIRILHKKYTTKYLEERGDVEKGTQVRAVVLCAQLLQWRVVGQRPPHDRQLHAQLTGNMRQVLQPLYRNNS